MVTGFCHSAVDIPLWALNMKSYGRLDIIPVFSHKIVRSCDCKQPLPTPVMHSEHIHFVVEAAKCFGTPAHSVIGILDDPTDLNKTIFGSRRAKIIMAVAFKLDSFPIP